MRHPIRLVFPLLLVVVTACSSTPESKLDGSPSAGPRFRQALNAHTFFNADFEERAKACPLRTHATVPDADKLLAADGFEILEISGTSTAEELWDAYLTNKHNVFGAAYERKPGKSPRTTIQYWADAPSRAAACQAMRNGDFFSSKGVKLAALVVTPRTLELTVEGWRQSEDHVDFIGRGGILLERTFANPARYVLRGNEGYVRARVQQAAEPSSGIKREAWTQAYFMKND